MRVKTDNMRKVYIVDDYKGTREACRLALNDIGFRDEEIYEFGTERAFYEAAEATRPDMVIVDGHRVGRCL